ncbi:L,D-transpeptidase [Streptomyces sp. NPDC053431]|uniref:L,D-transpeptidase n=1 Tax=Streptomyces sp. NPDC053431 TaxID=3365703 RepID=UPI0037D6ACB9
MPVRAVWMRGVLPVSAGLLLMVTLAPPAGQAPATVHRTTDWTATTSGMPVRFGVVSPAAPGSLRAATAARPLLRAGARPSGAGALRVRFGPGPGVYGVGQPLTAHLSHPVPQSDRRARAAVEQGLRVTSVPDAGGSWHWVDAQTLHFRPSSFWPAHAVITAHSVLDGVKITDTLYSGRSKALRISTGDRIEAVTDIARFSMTVYRNGQAVRRIAVTTGKEGYRTRTGIKVVLEKQPAVRMKGDSIGIPEDSPDAYDLDVRHAVRVTWSGEYLHAAPWSADAHGRQNVSHGCTGMSTEDAAWLYRTLAPGDVIRVLNGPGPHMDAFSNGYGDWNLSWSRWRAGSALPPPPAAEHAPASAAPRMAPLL